ncbi:MAG: hypothetical protein WD030_10060, partial [Pirellulales bacterium]
MISILGLIVLVLIVGAVLCAAIAGLTALARWNKTAFSLVLGGGLGLLLLIAAPLLLLALWITPMQNTSVEADYSRHYSGDPPPTRPLSIRAEELSPELVAAPPGRVELADEVDHVADESDASKDASVALNLPVSPETERPQPEGTRITSEPRPDWVDAPAAKQGNVYRQVVHAGPHPRRIEAEKELEEQIHSAVEDYLNEAIAPDAARRVELPADYVRREIVRDQFTEVHQRSFGTLADDVYMVDLYAQLEFSRQVHDEAKERYRQAVVEDRLWLTGFSLAAALGLLGTVFGYLRFDEATGGRRRGRLRFVATGAILALAVAGLLAARWSP